MRASLALLIAFLPGAAMAQTPPELSDLVGARGAGGETQLEARGYRNILTNAVRDTKYSFWWNERRRQCISVATTEGRYAAIQIVPPGNCDAVGDEGAPPPPPPGHADRIDLVCIGSGSGPAARSDSGYRYNSKTRNRNTAPRSAARASRPIWRYG
ncbi:hypothetical protein [Sphingomonas sp. AP4-R1]|uniref:hypothetical protein n=1 Tax=Sphingomonas sp. AP4-R1 TaxID=2735134 RepID=UPI0020A34735|nr:hypothetical protein [Sphingomonas sp. AP4-R1]